MFISNNNLVRISIFPIFQEELSSKHNFFWEYSVSLENKSNKILQFLEKHLQIIESNGNIIEVSMDNIQGEKPVLKPGDIFEYSRVENLRTSSAIIRGRYKILSNGREFDIEVPTFSLDNPYEIVSIN